MTVSAYCLIVEVVELRPDSEGRFTIGGRWQTYTPQ